MIQETIDCASSTDELMFQYDPEKGFDYNEFTDLVLDIMPEYLETEYLGKDNKVYPMPRIEDCPDEFCAMFERMGVKRLDGRKNFYYSKPMTYIHAVTPRSEEDGPRYESTIRSVEGMLTICPKNLQIIT